MAGMVTSCSPDEKDSSVDVSPSAPPSISSSDSPLGNFSPRSPDEAILGKSEAGGLCNPSVIDIDHEKNTAQFEYSGQPGDKISLEIFMDDGSSESESFELGSTNTSWQVPTSIYNGDIDYIKVSADGRVGKPGSCKIQVG